MKTRSGPAWLVAFGAYVGVTAAFLAPVLSRLGGTVMGRADAMQFLWGAWWMDQTLLEGRNPFFTDALFAPIGSPLVFHSYAPLQSASVAVLAGVLPVEVAWNLVMAFALPLAGLSAWALCRDVGGDAVASWVGGLAFMLSPFVAGKLGAGWLNLVYAAVLPFFTLALLRATDPADEGWKARGLLASATLLVLWTSVVFTVFAANIALCVFVWRAWRDQGTRMLTLRRWLRAGLPALLLSAPYLILVVYYGVTEAFAPTARTGETGFLPHLTDFLLPTFAVSPYSEIVRWWVGTEGFRFDSACYLGILVLPMALVGGFRLRPTSHAMLFGGIGVFALALSIGPFLMIDGQFVQLFGRSVPLPFAIWREVPLLGMVGQTGRYMVIVYLAMAVGVSAFVGWLRARSGRSSLVVVGASLAICVDFAFQPILMPLPEPIQLSGPEAIVLEPRGYVGETMYQQTLHGRPMVGGYLSRRPPRALAFYQERPGVACLMPFLRPRIPCVAGTVLPALRELGVTDVLGSRGDSRTSLYHEIGLIPNTSHETTVVWAVPAADEAKAR
jgi:hypothetical protein